MARPVKDFFVYQLNFLALVAGAQATQALQFDASSDFTWLYSAYAADTAAAAVTEATRVYPLATVLITPSDSSAQFSNGIGVPIPAIFGNGENPFLMPVPRMIAARSSLSFQVNNYDAAATYNIRLSLIGIKNYLG